MNKQKSLDEIKNIILSHKNELTEKYKVKNIGIFGSYITGRQNKKSDVDILVEYSEFFDTKLSLLDQAALWNYLDDILEIKTDLAFKKSLRSEIKNNILKEVVYL
ncbi:MAG: nucleotidyltransferase family protein [Elusimicrobiota bacterium]